MAWFQQLRGGIKADPQLKGSQQAFAAAYPQEEGSPANMLFQAMGIVRSDIQRLLLIARQMILVCMNSIPEDQMKHLESNATASVAVDFSKLVSDLRGCSSRMWEPATPMIGLSFRAPPHWLKVPTLVVRV